MLVQKEGKRKVKRNRDHYNLDMIISLEMTNFKGEYVTIDDVKIVKNYLSEIELQRFKPLVSQF